MRRTRVLSLLLSLLLAGMVVPSALAHQPYFEEEDIEAGEAWEIDDPAISTAWPFPSRCAATGRR